MSLDFYVLILSPIFMSLNRVKSILLLKISIQNWAGQSCISPIVTPMYGVIVKKFELSVPFLLIYFNE